MLGNFGGTYIAGEYYASQISGEPPRQSKGTPRGKEIGKCRFGEGFFHGGL